MRILFNDEPMSCDDGLTVAALLGKLRQLKPGTALALNQQILPREQWEHQQVNDGGVGGPGGYLHQGGCLILDTVDGPALFLGHLLAGGTGLHGIDRVLGAVLLAAGGKSGGDGQQQEQTDSALNDVLHDFLHSPAPIAGRFSMLIHYHTTEIK